MKKTIIFLMSLLTIFGLIAYSFADWWFQLIVLNISVIAGLWSYVRMIDNHTPAKKRLKLTGIMSIAVIVLGGIIILTQII